jgi:hypothetical protein
MHVNETAAERGSNEHIWLGQRASDAERGANGGKGLN